MCSHGSLDFFNICQRSVGWGCPNMAYTTKLRWYPGFRHTQMKECNDYIYKNKSGVCAKCWPSLQSWKTLWATLWQRHRRNSWRFFPFLRKSMKAITGQTQTLCSPQEISWIDSYIFSPISPPQDRRMSPTQKNMLFTNWGFVHPVMKPWHSQLQIPHLCGSISPCCSCQWGSWWDDRISL